MSEKGVLGKRSSRQKNFQQKRLAICWTRVDDRLIHGQVTVAWRQYLDYDRICIVDDSVRADPFLQDVLLMAAPPGVYANVYTIQEAITALKGVAITAPRAATGFKLPLPLLGQDKAFFPHKILLLVKTPQTALALFQGGVPITHLNVGNIAAGPGRKRVFKSTSLGPEHIAALDALAELGVHITFQLTPDDTRTDWQRIRQRL